MRREARWRLRVKEYMVIEQRKACAQIARYACAGYDDASARAMLFMRRAYGAFIMRRSAAQRAARH